MIQLKLKLIIITSVIVFVTGVILFYEKDKTELEIVDHKQLFQEYQPIEIRPEPILFYNSLKQAQFFEINGQLRGAIVPHHEVASNLLADFFASLAKNQEVENFIIIGPNHSDLAAWPAISAKVYWQTEMGTIYNSECVLDQLTQDGSVIYDQDNFIFEHSIKVLLPFIKYYFPEAKIVPIILTSRHDRSMTVNLAEKISDYLEDEKIVLLASLDFSHYLDIASAEQNDKVTLQAIYNKDYDLISSLNSDYLDSPSTLITLLKSMEISQQVDDFSLVYQSNSGEILSTNTNITSYIIGYFSN